MAGEKKVSQSGNKASQALSKSSCPESTQKTVPVFPIRYSVKPKDIEFEVDGTTLGFPEMKHSSYAMRLLRSGYVYLYDKERGDKGLHIWEVKEDGTFQKIVAKLGSISSIARSVYDRENKFYQLESRSTPYILARAEATEVYIGFSDALWTSDIFEKIIKNDENIRTNLMTKIDVKRWEIGDGVKTFDIEDLDFLVEEYRDNAIDLSWSPFKRKKPTGLESSLAEIKRLNPDSEIKTIGVMLYDNIGLVVDQGGIVDKYRTKLKENLQQDDSTHKKIVSDCVEMVYKLDVAKEIDSTEVEKYINETKESVKDANNPLKYNIASYSQQAEYRRVRGFFEPTRDFETVESKIFANYAKDRMRNIDENERLKFLKKYKHGYEILAKKLMESKNDRWKHLNSYRNPKKISDLGSSFLNYDVKNKVSADLHGQAFSFCIKGIMSDPYRVEDVLNREHDLFAEWMELPKGDDPLLNALVWGYDNKTDTMMGAIDALVSSSFSGIDSANESLKDSTKKQLNRLDAQQQQAYNALNKAQKDRFLLEKVVDDELNKLHAKYSNVEISQNIATYILTKPKRLNNAALTMANRKFSEYIYSAHPDKGDFLVNKMLEPKLSYNKNGSLKKIYLSPTEYKQKFSEAANLTTHETKKFHFKDAQSVALAQDEVKVLTKEKPFVFSVVNNTDILERQLNIGEMEDAVKSASQNVDNISDSIDDISQQSKDVESVFHKKYNPFVTKLSRGLSSLVILANAVNLSHAIDSFDSDDPIEKANMTAAITGTVAALFYVIDSFKTKTSTVQIIADMRVEPKVAHRFLKHFTRELGMRVFGVFAAVADATTQYLKGKKADKEDNREARDAYYLSAFLLGVGGVLTLFSSPILVVLGALALIGGMFALARADELVWDELDKWLNACVWRKRGADARVIPDNRPYGADLGSEYKGFVGAYYRPTVTLSWEKVTVGHPEYGSLGVTESSKVIRITIVLPYINYKVSWGYKRSVDEKIFAVCDHLFYPKDNNFSLTIDNSRDPYSYKPINFSIIWSMPFKTGDSYRIESHYQLKAGGEVKSVSPIVTKQ